jgi:hypothetical protein
MHDWMHVRGTYSLEKPGGLEGGPSFRRGVIAPPYQGVLPPSASLPAAVGLNDPLRPIRRKPGGISRASPAKHGAWPCR